jgi:hypothetical protein
MLNDARRRRGRRPKAAREGKRGGKGTRIMIRQRHASAGKIKLPQRRASALPDRGPLWSIRIVIPMSEVEARGEH